nr:MAG TPA: NAD-dependent deacetylase [Caudoviricetes sp.]
MENESIFKNFLNRSNRTVFFSGAGASTESGIPDFRSSKGIFSKKLNKNISLEELVSRTFFDTTSPGILRLLSRESCLFRCSP